MREGNVQPCCKLFFSRYVREVGKGSVTLWRSTILLWVRFGCLSTGECYGYGWILIWATLGRLRPLAGDTYCVYYYIYACVYTTLCDCTAYYYHCICIEVVLCMYHLYHTLTPHTWRTIPILHSPYIHHSHHTTHIWHTLYTLSIIAYIPHFTLVTLYAVLVLILL